MLCSNDNPWRPLTALYGERAEDRQILEETRAEELHIVNNMVASSRVSLLYAMSGSGKTSLLQAGVIPFFQRRGHIVFTTRPRPPWARDDPRRAFRSCIARQVPAVIKDTVDQAALAEVEKLLGEQGRTDLTSVIARLRPLVDVVPAPDVASKIEKQILDAGGESLRAFMNSVADLVGRQHSILLVCDQFEELFVHYANHPHFHTFLTDLAAVWADETLNVRLLFSMREDWVGSMIALRRVIPDVFKDTFRLLPLKAEVARLVLERPLQNRGIAYEEGAFTTIVNDLVDAYETTDTRRLGNIEPQQSQPGRYLELMALQLVAGRLWETRESQRRPFTLDHYESLGTGAAQGRSPAVQVIENYLAEELVPAKDAASGATRELQIDSVYLLTDRDRHRRACSAGAIATEVKRIRPEELYPVPPLPQAVDSALKPLVRAGLVRAVDTTGDEPDFELAHDFAVRAAVKTWRELDYRRAKNLGRAARERERKEERLQHLEARNETTTLMLQIAPLVGLVGLVWAGIKLYAGDPSALGINPAEARPGLLVFAAFTALLAAGVIARHSLSLIIAAIAIVVGVVTMIWIGDTRQQTSDIYLGISADASRIGKSSPSSPAQHIEDITGIASKSGRPDPEIMDNPEIAEVFNSSYVYRARAGLVTLKKKLQQVGAFLLLATAVLLVMSVRSEAALFPEDSSWRRTLFVMWGELLDLLTFAPAVSAAVWIFLTRRFDLDLSMMVFGFSFAVTIIIRQVVIRKLRSTPGMRTAGFLVASNGWFPTLFRDQLFAFWSILNLLALLPWLLGGLYVYSSGRTLVDRFAGTRLIDVEDSSGKTAAKASSSVSA
jgi:hypothetical protein